jgi:DNA-binding transcriptional MerR regulator
MTPKRLLTSDKTSTVSIRTVSADLGITPRALRHWDAEGLIPVERDRRNRRMFSLETCRELEVVARLRGAGVPIEEIRWVLQAARRKGLAGLRHPAVDCLTHQLGRLAAQQVRAEQALDWVRTFTEQGLHAQGKTVDLANRNPDQVGEARCFPRS